MCRLTAKDERHMISLIQSKRHKDVTIFDDIDATTFGIPGVLKRMLDKDNITKISSRYKQGAWVSHIIKSSQHPRLEIKLRE